jgi:gliding motility-associated-like protein
VEIKQQLENDAFVSWSTPQGIITNTRKINATRAGRYVVSITSPQHRSPVKDSCFVKISPKVKPVLRDTILCKGKSLVLDAKYEGLRFQWSTGESTQKIKVESGGRYWVKIRNGTCVTIDTVIVKTITPPPVYVPDEVTFCYSEEHKVLSVKAGQGTKFFWNTGATTPTMQVSKEGSYWVRTENKNCGSQVDTVKVKLKICECEMIIPNSFTPNEDNRNDLFFPVVQCDYSYFNMTITDRWGNTVYSSYNLNGKWDGRFKGNLCPEDIYVYRIESTERGSDKKQVRNGQISLFR